VIDGTICRQTLHRASKGTQRITPVLGRRLLLVLKQLMQFGVHLFQLGPGQAGQFCNDLVCAHEFGRKMVHTGEPVKPGLRGLYRRWSRPNFQLRGIEAFAYPPLGGGPP